MKGGVGGLGFSTDGISSWSFQSRSTVYDDVIDMLAPFS